MVLCGFFELADHVPPVSVGCLRARQPPGPYLRITAPGDHMCLDGGAEPGRTPRRRLTASPGRLGRLRPAPTAASFSARPSIQPSFSCSPSSRSRSRRLRRSRLIREGLACSAPSCSLFPLRNSLFSGPKIPDPFRSNWHQDAYGKAFAGSYCADAAAPLSKLPVNFPVSREFGDGKTGSNWTGSTATTRCHSSARRCRR